MVKGLIVFNKLCLSYIGVFTIRTHARTGCGIVFNFREIHFILIPLIHTVLGNTSILCVTFNITGFNLKIFGHGL